MPGLWKNQEGTREGKYLVTRRDGTVPEWPYIVMGAKDPAVPAALRAYALKASSLGMDVVYVSDILALADEFDEYRAKNGEGNPDGAKHREDDPETIEKMKQVKGS